MERRVGFPFAKRRDRLEVTSSLLPDEAGRIPAVDEHRDQHLSEELVADADRSVRRLGGPALELVASVLGDREHPAIREEFLADDLGRDEPLVLEALAAGVALAVGAAVLVSSIDHSSRTALRSIAGRAQLRVVGNARDQAWVTESDVRRISAVPGVAAAIPVVQTVAIAEGATHTQTYVLAIGADCRAAYIVGAATCDQAVVDRLGAGPALLPSSLKRQLGPD